MRLFIILMVCFQSFLVGNDVGVIVYDHTLNKFLSHIGSVEGKGEADVSFSTISYSWSVTQPRIQFTDGVGLFTADVSINAGVIRYNTPAKGRVNVTFDDASNTIKFDVQSISFELYTELFGNRIHISDVDIASFFPLDFEMEGPPIFTRRTVLNVPSGTKIIDVSTGKRSLSFHEGFISVESELILEEVIPTPNI